MAGIIREIALARQARRIAAATKPADLPKGVAGQIDQMLATVETALNVGLSQPEYENAAAIATVVRAHRRRLEALFQRAADVAGAGQLSPDGKWRWDGTQWQPVGGQRVTLKRAPPSGQDYTQDRSGRPHR